MKKYTAIKNVVSLALALCLFVLTLAGCASFGPLSNMPPAQTQVSETPELSILVGEKPESTPNTSPEPIPEPTPTIAPIKPINTYVSTITDSDGYIIEATLKLTDWIKGSEYDLLNESWKGVGGDNDFPTYLYDDFRGQQINLDVSVVTVGTVSFKNKTDGFDITKTVGPKNVVFDVRIKNASIMKGVEYSTGIDYKKTEIYGWVRPTMTKNNWGPVSVFLVARDVFAPNSPNGERLDKYEIYNWKETSGYWGTTELIDLGKTWGNE